MLACGASEFAMAVVVGALACIGVVAYLVGVGRVHKQDSALWDTRLRRLGHLLTLFLSLVVGGYFMCAFAGLPSEPGNSEAATAVAIAFGLGWVFATVGVYGLTAQAVEKIRDRWTDGRTW